MPSFNEGAVPLSVAEVLADTHPVEAAADDRTAKATRARDGIGTAVLVTLVGLVSVAFIFRYQIFNRFTLLNGNRYDQVIIDAIYEHWFSVFRGMASWTTVGYYYPIKGSLGYNDGFFLYGVAYSLFRLIHLDPYLSGECVSIVVRLVGFFGFYVAARRLLNIRPGWATLCAVLFTLSNNLFIQDHHPQLLSVSFVPIMAVLLDGLWRAMLSGSRVRVLRWGIPAGCLYAAWLLTAFYMAWYFVFFGAFMCVAYAAFAGRAGLLPIWTTVRQNAASLAIVSLVFVLACVPFLLVYLPKARETGMHPYRAAQIHTLTLPDLMDVGHGNLLYGRIAAFVDHAIRPAYPAWSERMTGFPPALLLLFACGVVIAIAVPRALLPQRPNLLRAVAAATLATWVLAFNVDGHSAWWFVYKLFPGAKAARVVGRYQLFVTVPVIAIAVLYLSASARKIVAPVLVLVCALLVTEQINIAPLIALNRPHELAFLASVPPPPANCEAFFTSSARPERVLDDPDLEDFFSHNVDATIIAEVIHLPTINGASTFQPPNWNLVAPGKPDYLDKVRRYAVAHHVTQLCGLDLKTLQWSRMQLAGTP